MNLFLDMGTQWYAGTGGALGLRYESLEFVMRRNGIKTEEEQDEMFPLIKIMEEAALEQMRLNKG